MQQRGQSPWLHRSSSSAVISSTHPQRSHLSRRSIMVGRKGMGFLGPIGEAAGLIRDGNRGDLGTGVWAEMVPTDMAGGKVSVLGGPQDHHVRTQHRIPNE